MNTCCFLKQIIIFDFCDVALVRDDKLFGSNPVKITGEFIVGGMVSSFQAPSQPVTKDTAERMSNILDQVTTAMDKGGSKRLARQINRSKLPVNGSKVDDLTQYRLKKLDRTLKRIAADLSG